MTRDLHQHSYGAYGDRKMWHAMVREGWDTGRDQVARLTRMAGLQGVRRGRRPLTTRPSASEDHRPDLVRRRFKADRPSTLWVADFNYIRCAQGSACTAFITDVAARRIVVWATSASMSTHTLPLAALEHALVPTGASRSTHGLIHHCDRGSRYVSLAYSNALIGAGTQASVGSVGDSYDNALAETVNGLYTTEVIHTRRLWPSVKAVETATLDWVAWWSTRRLHNALGHKTPTEAETHYNHHHAPAPVGST